jgi:hypothetical protein
MMAGHASCAAVQHRTCDVLVLDEEPEQVALMDQNVLRCMYIHATHT